MATPSNPKRSTLAIRLIKLILTAGAVVATGMGAVSLNREPIPREASLAEHVHMPPALVAAAHDLIAPLANPE